ncbi:MAG: aminotransferase class I/II-fold pyridoxal phosphate-dependent enzyme [Planctomycetia bacterium]|nr:aminotransferase class I/II-fold pyridoxal phosphate-dependent enzyme [Planctomycetia bacterium]
MPTSPLASPIYQAAVYRCEDPEQAGRLLSGQEEGYVYSRDRNPNSDLLAERVRALHGAEKAIVCGSGMAACSAIFLAHLTSGDHVVVGDQMYGRTLTLLEKELSRLGIRSTRVDVCEPALVRAAMTPATKLVVVETITNPLVRVVDVAKLADVAHAGQARLVVDNTFASPVLCRPLELGADIVFESLTKIMNGHSDVLLGAVCGRADAWERMVGVVGSYGLSAAPFDSWLAARGIGTLALRAERASSNALAAARFLAQRAECARVYYPGLEDHPDHATAARQFAGRFGSMLSFTLAGGSAAAQSFITAAKRIPFCPSLGDLSTTLSHPESTSHRGLTAEERAKLQITGGTIRLSVGIESPEAILAALEEGLAGI